MGKQRSILILILLLVMAAITVIVQLPVHLGLDLQGGSQLTIQVQVPQGSKPPSPEDLEAVRSVLENRVNGLGVSEALVQTAGQDQILVQLPGVSDPEQAERVLGGTAQLEFRAQKPGTEAQLRIESQQKQEKLTQLAVLNQTGDRSAITKVQQELKVTRQEILNLFEDQGLTGKNLADAFPEPKSSSNTWNVGIRFDTKGGELFAALTKKLAGTGRAIGIFLDQDLISAPVVPVTFAETGITGGSAIIEGNFDAQTSLDLAVQLRGGALPFPVAVVENRTVGATLGRDSIQSSIYAGIGGLLLVLIFMVAYYRLPGAIADLSLLIYSLLTFACFDLLGVTLTLPGIAGFILSIGMAVDANVLIFERTREELRAGKSLYRAVESGFYRAFSSILDSNVTTLIACAALFWLGAGLVRGFALTLALGVVVSMFTAITCSRTLLLVALSIPVFRKPRLFCPNLPTGNPTARIA
ncbi:preprotein translocase subunit SecD [Neosynechococcus sphagnicola sy1]|uniref:Protein translocase subunit SecD n=1 Tax=Neosynechococcus sphagnicola sy1 TaxID=1497020 RepID=A0A098TQA0_9CYAN|nr:protein translocase subunit SecD [Neosynechococcus sphagnicola]KGF73003.1 preprotein translocase subunit SecD [Neosynechococcus sphagnicola sy1]